ncbi:uncharacterized protein LOC121177001 isoform X2 [Toxotes jaculatrix]|uniref:uncharacterized protein LOC121177001 isoform X2 n=1 Tax=Toxotes jaculatrix TaxID=941984 RepID=UPI001B3AC0BC|nr:uncharacterized protein LOC121177001 isoform X2 [Toxotes jaculatrix]
MIQRMVLFSASKLLLMTLLLQLTEEITEWKTHSTPKPDKSAHVREFCLHVSDGSQWTSSKPDTQPPTKSAPPAKRLIQRTKQATKQPALPQIVTQEPTLTVPVMQAPSELFSLVTEDCRCKEENMKQPDETSTVKRVKLWLPHKTCRSMELTATLKNGTEVCVTQHFLSLFIRQELLSHRLLPVHEIEAAGEVEPTVTSPSPLDPTTESSVTEIHPDPELPTFFAPTPTEEDTESSGLQTDESLEITCESCTASMNVADIDPKAVLSLNMKMESFPCPAHIYVSLEDGQVFCVDSHELQFATLLEKLEDRFKPAPNNIVLGCRCQGREKKRPSKKSAVTSAKIWPPNGSCSSAEFIETLKDGGEVCVSPSSLSEYFGFASLQGRRLAIEDKALHISTADEKALSSRIMVMDPCTVCGAWVTVDLNDVESLWMDVQSPPCPILVHVKLKNKEQFCVDSSQLWFRTLLENLDI